MNPKKSEQVVLKAAQKRSETKPEEINATELFIDTFWDQYEEGIDKARQFREEREDAYLISLKEVIKLNQEFRKSLNSLYRESKETNIGIVKGVSDSITSKTDSNFSEITSQVGEVSSRLEKLALTPIKSSFELIDRFEKSIEESNESFIQYSRERSNGWQNVTNEFIKLARTSQKSFLNRFEEGFKVLTNEK